MIGSPSGVHSFSVATLSWAVPSESTDPEMSSAGIEYCVLGGPIWTVPDD